MNIENWIIKVIDHILYWLGINLIEDGGGINENLREKYDDL
jgi:hypothetical protein